MFRSTYRPSWIAQSTTCLTRAIHVGSMVYGAVADWWPLHVTGRRMLRKPCAFTVSSSCLVISGLPHEVSSGMASSVLPMFQLGCMAATVSIAGLLGAGRVPSVCSAVLLSEPVDALAVNVPAPRSVPVTRLTLAMAAANQIGRAS